MDVEAPVMVPNRRPELLPGPWQIARMVILQAIVIGSVIVAGAVAARIIAAADYRLAPRLDEARPIAVKPCQAAKAGKTNKPKNLIRKQRKPRYG